MIDQIDRSINLIDQLTLIRISRDCQQIRQGHHNQLLQHVLKMIINFIRSLESINRSSFNSQKMSSYITFFTITGAIITWGLRCPFRVESIFLELESHHFSFLKFKHILMHNMCIKRVHIINHRYFFLTLIGTLTWRCVAAKSLLA